MAFGNHTETNPHTRIVLNNISLNSGLQSNLLRKIAIIRTSFYFPAEQESLCIQKKNRYISVNSTGHDLDASFL